MIARPWHWGVAIGLSAGAHVAIAALLFDAPEVPAENTGAGVVTASIAGDSLADLLAAGAIEPEAPVQTEALQPIDRTAPSLEPLRNPAPPTTPTENTDQRAPVPNKTRIEAIQPDQQSAVANPETLTPHQTVADSVPIHPAELQQPDRVEAIQSDTAGTAVAALSAEALEPVQPTETIAATEPVAVPIPRPRPQRAATSPATSRHKPAQQRALAPANRPSTQQARAKSGGEAGQARQTARQGSRQTANAAATTRAGQRAVANYPGRVARKLRRSLRYPRDARRAGVTGQAQVRFTVRANGQATSVRVVRGSGSPVLDRAAVETVQSASPFPPIPREAGRSSWTFTVPLAFGR